MVVRRAASRADTILTQALLRPDLLAVVDPVAARSTAASRGVPVWYVRMATSSPADRPPQVAWAVIEDATGLVVGYSWRQP
jgi:hypothetical protein